MDVTTLLSLPAGIEVTALSLCPAILQVQLASLQPTAPCPLCSQDATRVHSQYQRTVLDLPCAGRRVRLDLRVRKFFCETAHCPRKIFAERFPDLVEPFARCTTRLCQALQAIGLSTCSRGGARLAAKVGMDVTPPTLLRRMLVASISPSAPVRVLGVDDWSFRRGHHYGAILVDLERRRVVDLLPDRTAETFAAWLEAHPSVEVISRDRGGAFADGARRGAPQAVQIADHFHLLKNLGEMVERVITRLYRQVADALQTLAPFQSPAPTLTPPSILPGKVGDSRARRLALYEQVQALVASGMSQRAIARTLQIGRDKASRFAQAPTFPERRQGTRRPSILDPYLPYIEQRWQAGCHNGSQIFRELQAQGFAHPRPIVAQYIARRRTAERAGLPPPTPTPPLPSARQIRWALLLPEERLTEEQQAIRGCVLHAHPQIGLAVTLVHEFATMLRERKGDRFHTWLAAMEQSRIPECRRVAIGMKGDLLAIVTALESEVSNGQVEGQVHRLKLIKRMMYGRAGFPLLRQRVLQPM